MKFGRVEGICVPVTPGDHSLLRVTVYLESDMGLDVVREVEIEPELREDGSVDLWWEADQWTQDTIATLLLPRGWELLGATDSPQRLADEVPRSPRYALRTPYWVPPPGWDDEP